MYPTMDANLLVEVNGVCLLIELLVRVEILKILIRCKMLGVNKQTLYLNVTWMSLFGHQNNKQNSSWLSV